MIHSRARRNRAFACNPAGQAHRHVPAEKDDMMQFTFALAPLVSLIAGILILIVPRLLNYIVALYLIIIGLIGLFGGGRFQA